MALQVLILTGATGSGKTELSLNLSLKLRKELGEESPVFLVDLDLVTPFFRSRDQRQGLLTTAYR